MALRAKITQDITNKLNTTKKVQCKTMCNDDLWGINHSIMANNLKTRAMETKIEL